VGIPKDELADFFRIRHKMCEKTGAREGLVVMVFCCHRLHETPIALRSDYDSLLVLGVPMNDWDYNFIASKVGEESVKFLDEADENNEKGNIIVTYRRKFLGITKIPKLTFSIPVRNVIPPTNPQGTNPYYYRQRMQTYQPRPAQAYASVHQARPDNPEPVRIPQFRPENVICRRMKYLDEEMGRRFSKKTEHKINLAVPIVLFIVSAILYEAGCRVPYFLFH